MTAAVALCGAVALSGGCSPASAQRDESEQIAEAGDLASIALRVGDCFIPPEDHGAEVTTVDGVPCDQPHHHEVIALVEFAGDLRPDDGELGAFAASECLATFEPYVGRDYLESSLLLSYLLPSVRGWNEVGDRSVVCVAHSPTGELTSSVQGRGL